MTSGKHLLMVHPFFQPTRNPNPLPPEPPKLFVVDTNVILHDAECIRRCEENDIAIPIAVLEELDKFKKGNEDIHFQARAFLRILDELTGDVLSSSGVTLGPGLGSIRIVLGDGPDAREQFAVRP